MWSGIGPGDEPAAPGCGTPGGTGAGCEAAFFSAPAVRLCSVFMLVTHPDRLHRVRSDWWRHYEAWAGRAIEKMPTPCPSS